MYLVANSDRAWQRASTLNTAASILPIKPDLFYSTSNKILLPIIFQLTRSEFCGGFPSTFPPPPVSRQRSLQTCSLRSIQIGSDLTNAKNIKQLLLQRHRAPKLRPRVPCGTSNHHLTRSKFHARTRTGTHHAIWNRPHHPRTAAPPAGRALTMACRLHSAVPTF